MDNSYNILLPGVPVSSNRGALGWCSVVLIRGAGQNVLFDTGSYGDRSQLIAALQAHHLSADDIRTVFLSHFHYDHVLNADLFPNARLLISAAEWDYVQSGAFHQANDPYVPTGFIPWAEQRVEVWNEAQELLPGLIPLPLPGHTPGLCGLLLTKEKVLMAGDGVKNGWEFVRRQPPPSFFSSKAALESYRRAAAVAELIIPGHDRPFRIHQTSGIDYLAGSPVEISFSPATSAFPRKIPLSWGK